MPLLQHALRELWKRRHGRWLRAAEYRAIGGVKRAIAETAEAVYRDLSSSEQERIRDIFGRLTRLDEDSLPSERRRDTRQRVWLEELVPAGSNLPETKGLVKRLADNRLVVTSMNAATGREEIEVAHEALIRHWPRLRGWLDEDRTSLRLRAGIRESARQWQAEGEDESWLEHRGSRLDDAEKLRGRPRFSLNAIEQAYIEACAALREREKAEAERRQQEKLEAAQRLAQESEARRQAEVEARHQAERRAEQEAASSHRLRRLAATIAGLALVAMGLAAAAWMYKHRADNNAQVAETNAQTAKENEQTAYEAKAKAEENEAQAQKARQRAEALARENHDRLVRHYVGEGSRLLEEGDLLGSLTWFAKALKEDEGDRRREWVHRTRLAAVAQQCPRLLQTLLPEGPVSYAEFSPDDRYVVTASSNLARVWDAATGAPASPPLRHAESVQFASLGNTVHNASFSPDGRRLVTGSNVLGSEESEIRLWEAATGKPLTPPVKLPGVIQLASFNPRGDRLVTMANPEKAGGEARVWDATTLRLVSPPLKHRMRVTHAIFSPDGRRVLTTSWDGTGQIWDAATGKPVLSSPHRHLDNAPVLHGAFSPDGSQVITTSGNARIWDSVTGKLLVSLGHSKGVWQAAFSPNGQLVVTASMDQTARVWRWGSNQPIGLPMRHQDEVLQVSFSPDGRQVLTTGKDRAVRIWDAFTGQAVTPPLRHTDAVSYAAFSHDGRRVLTASKDGTVRIWEVAPAERRTPPLEYSEAGRQAVAISPDGRRLLTKSPLMVPEYPAVLAGTPAAGFPASIPWAALFRTYRPAAVDKALYKAARVWDLTTGKALTPPLIHTLALESGLFSPDGSRVLLVSARGADKGKAWLWEVATGKPAAAPMEHPGPVRYAAFSLDGRLAVTTSDSPSGGRTVFSPALSAKNKGEARVWDAETGQLVCGPLEHQTPIRYAAFSPDGRRLVTTAALDPEGGVQVWDVATGRSAAPRPYDGSSVLHASFSPDGSLLATATSSGSTGAGHVWKVATGTTVGKSLKHDGWVTHVAFSPGGRRVVTASRDGTARIWDAVTGEPLTQALRHEKDVWYATFSGDGRLVATAAWAPGASEGTARVWDAETGDPVTPSLKHPFPLAYVNRARFSSDGSRLFTESANNAVGGIYDLPVTARQIWVWNLATDNRPAKTVLLLAEWLAGQRVDDTGSLVALTWTDAIEHWSALIDARPGHWPLHYRRGRAYADLGHWKEAIADYTRAIELGATDREVWFYRGQGNYQLKDWDRVVADHSKAIEMRENRMEVWSERGTAYLNLGQFDKVVPDATKLIQNQPQFWAGWFMRGAANAALQQWDKAEVDYAKAVELGAWPPVWHGHALVRLGANDLPGYRKACARLLERYSKTPSRDPAFYAAWACVLVADTVSDPTLPLQLAERALEQSPKTWAYLLVRGAALYRAGRFEEAVKQLNEALAARQAEQASGHQSDDRVSHPFLDCAYDLLFLAMAQQRLGNTAEARQALDEAVRWLEQPPPKIKSVGNNPAYSWGRRLTHQQLRREAEALIKGRVADSRK
jgi:WD40 repeat protein